jgi:hypothetical protein
MDPVTIIGGATVAFNAIKKGLAVGKDLQDMHGQLSQWAGAMSDLGQAEKKAKNPPWWKSLGGSVEEEAMAVFAAKRKAESMREELRQYISFTMGPSAWDELVATEAKIRKQKKDQEYRKAEMIETIITWTLGALMFLIASALISAVLYYIGVQQGKW